MPMYRFRCPACSRTQDRVQVLYAEKDTLPCESCGHAPMVHVFVPTRNKAVVYANDKNLSGGEQFTGPRQKQRWLHERGLVELGDADYDAAMRPAAQAAAELEAKEEAETFDAIMEDMRHYEDSQILIGDETREDDPITGVEGPQFDAERLKVEVPVDSFGMEADE